MTQRQAGRVAHVAQQAPDFYGLVQLFTRAAVLIWPIFSPRSSDDAGLDFPGQLRAIP